MFWGSRIGRIVHASGIDFPDLLGIAGFLALLYGLAQVSIPVMWILGGAICFAVAIGAAWRSPRR